MPKRSRRPIILALALLLLGTLVPRVGASTGPAGQATPGAAETAIELRVMTFNVWLGGVQVDIGKVVEAITAAEADVVGLQEAEGRAEQIAAALGWLYVDRRLQIISRFPLLDPPGGDGVYTFVQTRPGRVVALANVHLPADPYVPTRSGTGWPPATCSRWSGRRGCRRSPSTWRRCRAWSRSAFQSC